MQVNGRSAKPSARVVVGDRVEARLHDRERIVEVARLIDKRVGASVAVGCYIDHTPPPPPATETAVVASREPGAGRPTKRDRRQLDRWRARDR